MPLLSIEKRRGRPFDRLPIDSADSPGIILPNALLFVASLERQRVAAGVESMPYFFVVRACSVLAVVILKTALDRPVYISLFNAVLFAHYVVALIYSRRQVRQLFSGSISLAPLAVLGMAGLLTPITYFPNLVLYFGIHVALTDGYMVSRVYKDQLTDEQETPLLLSRLAVALAAYCVLAWRLEPLAQIPLSVLVATLAGAYGVFLLTVLRVQTRLQRTHLLDMLLLESLAAGCLVIALVAHVEFKDLVFYHLVIWLILPLRKTVQIGRAATAQLVLQTVGWTAAFLLFTPVIGLFPAMTYDVWNRQGEIWGYLHITVSFAVSTFNPGWISRWFYPADAEARPEAAR